MYQMAPVMRTPMMKAVNAMHTTTIGSTPSSRTAVEPHLLDDEEPETANGTTGLITGEDEPDEEDRLEVRLLA